MPVSFFIKDVPDKVARQLRARAERHRRSLQGELLSILEESIAGEDQLSADDLVKWTRTLRLRTGAESTGIIRSIRNGR